MRLTVVGCTGSMPGPASPASCYLVEHDGYRLLLDLGNGALGALMTHIDLLDLDAIVLSHLHPDHFLDLTSLYIARTYGGCTDGRRLPVLGPAATSDRLADAYGMPRSRGMADSFEFRELRHETGIGPFRLRTARMAHPVEAYAVRLDSGAGSLTYSGDTGPTDDLALVADGCDVLLAESSFVDGAANPPDLHLTGRQAGEAAERAGVGSLVVTHVPPWNRVEVAVGEAETAFGGPVLAAAAGLSLDVGR